MKKPTEIGELLRQLVAEKAPTPEGFALADAKHLATQTTPKYCSQQVARGLLFKGKVGHTMIRYFSTAQAAKQFEADNKKPVLIAPSKPMRCMQGKAPAGPCVAAKIVYPDRYPKTVSLMARPRNQVITHSFIHNGMGAMR
jgi:hypothetical protein